MTPTYREARNTFLEGILSDYREAMASYREDILDGTTTNDAVSKLNSVISSLQINNKNTQDAIDTISTNMEMETAAYPRTKEEVTKYKEVLEERENTLDFNDLRLKEDIENDRWIHYKIYFFRIMIILLFLLMLYLLMKLYQKEQNNVPPTPAPTS